ncbi:MAG: 3-methyl-2-oxobutanoate dehydrogenase subunit VorB [Coriobacteriales bacterium]|jgi:2-oxoglutarate ferredoxin oxidoreductase subunit alpha|nr:3-methyl-2-oxobutanoate dehydrogenase subunit VorB [Coriobacteriales bacterium]
MAKVLMKGNEALAEGAIRAGCRHFFGYPITPQSELAAYMAKRMPKIGGTYLQAESEVSAINMVYGASAAGVRVMTSSSSPGVSLKGEGISYLIGADLPCLIVNVERSGPGLGGIQPSQGDYWMSTRATGHGDGHVLVLAPNSVQEMADFAAKAFELGDRFRMPAMILADGLLGQMMEPVELPEELDLADLPEKPWALTGTKLEREHHIANSLAMEPQDLEDMVLSRRERYRLIKATEQKCEQIMVDDAEVVVVAFGAASRIALSAVNAAREQGIKAGLIRPITLWPYPVDAVKAAAQHAKAFLSVEFSTGQMVEDVRLAVNGKCPVNFFGHTGGIVPDPSEALEAIKLSLERADSGEDFEILPFESKLGLDGSFGKPQAYAERTA